MSLRNYQAPRRDVPLPDGSTFSVRGLTFLDLSKLVMSHRDEFVAAGKIITANKDDMGTLALVLAQTLPGLIASAVAAAADEPDLTGVIESLPLPVQLDAILAVGELTVLDANSLPKILAGLARILRAGTSAMGGLTQIR
jgi:hypothetical protein